MLQVNVEKREETLKIEWQSAEIYIPLQEIVEVTDDCMSCINTKSIINIGSSICANKKVMIKTQRYCYILLGVDINAITNKIHLY
ncbi:hypothetical protein [Bacillus cereus]|uniref:SunI/YnzG family protein n=1 Tax=Bacillus cereus TaxID=1396 RepID=UPI000BF55E58|nr:hypothetical protein [Bacillus cereus]PFA86237.1 hypothetical protein CN393_23220 [Bacillus cereus]